VAFLWLLWRIAGVAWDVHRRAAGTRLEGLTLGYMAGLVAMITHGIGANTFIIVRIMEPFWFMTAIITLLPSLIGSEATQQAPIQSDRASDMTMGSQRRSSSPNGFR
jgi:hypothetical protein